MGLKTYVVVALVVVFTGIIYSGQYSLPSAYLDTTLYTSLFEDSSLSVLAEQEKLFLELANRVTIKRDEYNIPHIFGEKDSDVAFGLAYAHAEDDFLNIQRSYLAAKGKLGAVYGEKQATSDYLHALFKVNDRVEKYWEQQHSEKSKEIAQSYVNGLNYYALTHPNEILSNRPDVLFPLQASDVGRLFVTMMPMFMKFEKQLSIIMEEDPYYAVSMGRRDADVTSDPVGSTAYAMSPEKTVDGSTYLAINPHQPWEGVAAWYEVNLHSNEGWNITGALFPGSPVVIIGHTPHLGWAHTVNQPDILDIYLLQTKGNKYLYDGEWVEFESRQVTLDIQKGAPIHLLVQRTLLWSVHGPVFQRPHGTYAIRWAGFKRVGTLDQWFTMNKATSFEEWSTAFSKGMVPMFNGVYADYTGNIAYKYNALLPIRNPDYLWKDIIIDGTTSKSLWEDYLPTNQLPTVVNPSSGFLQNANNAPWNTTVHGNPESSSFSFSLGIEDRVTNRAIRLFELFEEHGDSKFSWDEFIQLKFDTKYSNRSDIVAKVNRLLDDVEFDERFQADPQLVEGFKLLQSWDYSTDANNPATALAVLTLSPFLILYAWDQDTMPDTSTAFYVVRNHFVQNIKSLYRYFNTTAVPWEKINRVIRGDINVGVSGGPDVLHCISGKFENGQSVGYAGDSYSLMVRWDKEGRVYSEAINVYGSAVTNSKSPHFNDQLSLFATKKFRKVHFNDVDQYVVSSYQPGQK